MIQVVHACLQVTIGVLAAGDFEAFVKFLLLVTARQFQSGEDFDGFDFADAMVVLHQVVNALAGDEVEFVVVVAQDALAQVNHRLAWRAHTEQDGEQFGSGETSEAVLLGLLTRAVLLRHRLFDVACAHRLAILSFLYHIRILSY